MENILVEKIEEIKNEHVLQNLAMEENIKMLN